MPKTGKTVRRPKAPARRPPVKKPTSKLPKGNTMYKVTPIKKGV